TGLLALAGILGVGEGHLFHHRKARRLVSGDFAKLGSLFQSFPNRDYLRVNLRSSGSTCNRLS
ncbi:hypothetical protein, partial [Pseudomonas amygdali]|uniref:hypothetical protein n=1 Tax=Pseudomonas amygdali TaxID=47877 RepID=UPI001FB79F0D